MISALVSLATGPAWTLVCGGDIMLYGLPPKVDPFKDIAPIFAKADVRYANLEVQLTKSTFLTPRKSAKELKAKTQFVLKADPAHAANLARLHLSFVSLANNHAMDAGWGGLKESIGILDGLKIKHSGAGANLSAAERMAVVTTAKGIRVGLLSDLGFVGDVAIGKCGPASGSSPGIAALAFHGVLGDAAREALTRRLVAAHKKADVVLVAMHWGVEREIVPTTYQLQLAHLLVECGADGVLGAHPHTIQGSEVYHGKPIEYSMGNLISPLPATTAIYRLKFQGTKFVGQDRIPCFVNKGVIRRVKAGFDAADDGLEALLPKVPALRASGAKPLARKKASRFSRPAHKSLLH